MKLQKDSLDDNCLNKACFDLVLLISFGVVSGVLLVVGLISLLEGFDGGLSAVIIVFGIGFILATIGLAQEFGFIEKWWF